MSQRSAEALERLPDEPRWLDVRGMLLSGRAEVRTAPGEHPSHDGFVVVVPDASIVAVVGQPPASTILDAAAGLGGDVNVLAQHEDAGLVAATLRDWGRRTAILHVLPGVMGWEADEDPGARVFTRANAPRLEHVPEPLRLELLDALRGRTTARFVPGALPAPPPMTGAHTVPMAAAWSGPLPVAFCYPVWQTARWWDVSIDTLEAHRRRGFGARAARALIRHLRATGRAPVWGALDSNGASRALAARLGFIEATSISVFARQPQ
jgi:GNAT superfamily N-acetyltransferase